VISAHAKHSFERIFRRAAQSRLALTHDDVCDIAAPSMEEEAAAMSDGEAVVLTISSIVFRLILVLHYREDASTRDYFVKDAAERSFQEVFLEICNLCCGAMNQELLRYFPDLGMSTPYVLNARCVPHLRALRPDYLVSHAITINDSVHLAATVCVCADAPVDFVADESVVEETSGELELF
jgi:hypothetical protein